VGLKGLFNSLTYRKDKKKISLVTVSVIDTTRDEVCMSEGHHFRGVYSAGSIVAGK
jgi:hypothetical protein